MSTVIFLAVENASQCFCLLLLRLLQCSLFLPKTRVACLRQLELVLNSAARLLTMTSYGSHITPVQMPLHWLLFQFGIQFKIRLLIYKALNHLAPEYIGELLMVYASVRLLMSSEQGLLVVP